jgi:hypothetical protein
MCSLDPASQPGYERVSVLKKCVQVMIEDIRSTVLGALFITLEDMRLLTDRPTTHEKFKMTP